MKNQAAEAYKRYAKARNKMKLNDYSVSKAANVSTGTLSDWKSGRYMPKFDKISKIAEVVNTTVSEIYGA